MIYLFLCHSRSGTQTLTATFNTEFGDRLVAQHQISLNIGKSYVGSTYQFNMNLTHKLICRWPDKTKLICLTRDREDCVSSHVDIDFESRESAERRYDGRIKEIQATIKNAEVPVLNITFEDLFFGTAGTELLEFMELESKESFRKLLDRNRIDRYETKKKTARRRSFR